MYNAPANATEEQKREMQQNKLNLQNTIQLFLIQGLEILIRQMQ